MSRFSVCSHVCVCVCVESGTSTGHWMKELSTSKDRLSIQEKLMSLTRETPASHVFENM